MNGHYILKIDEMAKQSKIHYESVLYFKIIREIFDENISESYGETEKKLIQFFNPDPLYC